MPPGPLGVIETPPDRIRAAIRLKVEEALAEIPKDKSGAIVAVATQDGVNLAVAHKGPMGWTVAAWVGKRWGAKGTDVGAQIKTSW